MYLGRDCVESSISGFTKIVYNGWQGVTRRNDQTLGCRGRVEHYRVSRCDDHMHHITMTSKLIFSPSDDEIIVRELQKKIFF
jgi:hypothetical protein